MYVAGLLPRAEWKNLEILLPSASRHAVGSKSGSALRPCIRVRQHYLVQVSCRISRDFDFERLP